MASDIKTNNLIFPSSFYDYGESLKISPYQLNLAIGSLASVEEAAERLPSLKSGGRTFGEVWWPVQTILPTGEFIRRLHKCESKEAYFELCLDSAPSATITFGYRSALYNHLKLLFPKPGGLTIPPKLDRVNELIRIDSEMNPFEFAYRLAGGVLFGPSGCGKTSLATALAKRFKGGRVIEIDQLMYVVFGSASSGWFSLGLKQLRANGSTSSKRKWNGYCEHYINNDTILVDNFRSIPRGNLSKSVYVDTSQDRLSWTTFAEMRMQRDLTRCMRGDGAWAVPQHPSISALQARIVRVKGGVSISYANRDNPHLLDTLGEFFGL